MATFSGLIVQRALFQMPRVAFEDRVTVQRTFIYFLKYSLVVNMLQQNCSLETIFGENVNNCTRTKKNKMLEEK